MKKVLCIISFAFLFLFGSTKSYAMKEIGDYGVNVDYVVDYVTQQQIRNSDYKITDDGRMRNQYDTISFNSIFSGQYNLSDLENQGYKTIVVELSFEAYEINDGYQYVFIYEDDTTSNYITGAKLDIPDKYNSNDPDNYILYFEAQISSLTNRNSFVVRYGASGAFSDTWVNKNLSVQVGFSYEAIKTSYMWRLKYVDDQNYTATRLTLAK